MARLRNYEEGMDAKKIIKDARDNKSSKGKFTFTIDKNLMKRFSEKTEDGLRSQIIEELIKEFLLTLDRK